MRLVPETLPRELARGLAPLWLVSGDEPLISGECADQIRARALADGYASREVHFVERGFDWQALLGETRAMSLFAERRLIELRLSSGKPGAEAARVLAEIAAHPPPDVVLLLIAGKLEWNERSAAWIKTCETQGAWVEVEQLAPEQLPAWITQRLARAGLRAEPEAVQLIADRCEGNLVAAHQEVERLKLLDAGTAVLDADTVAELVGNSARYNVFALGEALLAADPARTLRILEGLKAEGEEPVYVLWTVSEELRALLQWVPQAGRGSPGRLWRGGRRRQALLARAAQRLPRERVLALLARAALVDQVIKGARRGDAWGELAQLAMGAAGAGVELLRP